MNKKTALITGGARGIGAGISRKLAAQGYRVIVNYLSNEKAANEIVKTIVNEGGEALAMQADVLNETAVAKMFEQITEKFGGIDILVSNASIQFATKPFANMSWSEFNAKYENELKAAFLCTQSALPYMKQNKFGRLIFISSILSDLPSPFMIAHGTAKGALNSFNKYLAQELGGFGITSNIVAPGLVLTDSSASVSKEMVDFITGLTPIGRIANPDDVANAVSLFAMDESAALTGTYLPVCGGVFMK